LKRKDAAEISCRLCVRARTGRKSLGSLPKRMVREWFEARKAEQISKQSVGKRLRSPTF
jgi:hypothetical protein